MGRDAADSMSSGDAETDVGSGVSSGASSGDAETPRLRFRVGDRVSCWADDEWCRGTVVAVNWRRRDWTEDQKTAPYQVELDCGLLIYVPHDTEELCTAVERAWWEPALEGEGDAPVRTNGFDRPGPYLVVSNTWISSEMHRGGEPVADACPPLVVQVTEVSVAGDRVRGRVRSPDGWISLRSSDDEKVFAVPDDSAYACMFRHANPSIFAGESSTDDCLDAPQADSRTCAATKRQTCGPFSVSKLRALHDGAPGADVDQKDEKGRTALVRALQVEWLEGVQCLLEMRACPSADGQPTGRSPLHLAVLTCKAAILPLLEAGADPSVQDTSHSHGHGHSHESDRSTPLHHCAEAGHVESVVALLDARACPNALDADLATPLQLAIDEEHHDVVDALLSRGADANLPSTRLGSGSSPLMGVACMGDQALIKKLVGARADVNAKRTCDSMTALHFAVREGHEGAARALVEARCDVRHSALGMTAADLAARQGMNDLAAFLGGLMN